MASWRMVALLGLGALGAVGCGSKSSSGDDDTAGKNGTGAGGSSANGGAGGTSASGGAGANVGTGAKEGTGGVTTLPQTCGALTSADASRIATTNVANVLHAAVADARFTEGSELIARAENGGDQTSDAFTFADADDKSIDDFIDDLNSNVFADANVESTTANSVTYHQTPDVNCPLDQDLAMVDPDLAAQDRQDCIDDLMTHVERWTVSRVDCDQGDVVTIALEVGDDRSVPGFVTAGPTSLSLAVDLAEFVHAEQEYGDTTSYDAGAAGAATLVLDTGTTGVASFTAAVGSALALGTTSSGGDHIAATLAATSDALKLTADSNAQKFTGSLDLGALNVLFPLRSFIESAFRRNVTASTPNSAAVSLAIPALTGSFEYDRSADTLALTDLGLGGSTTTVKSGSATLLTVDVNPDAARRLDAGLAFDSTGALEVSPAPGFDVELGYSLQPVANMIEDLEAYANDDAVAFKLVGTSPMATLLKDFDGNLALTSGVSGAALRVNAGNFAMTSKNYASENVMVPSGQCLLYDSNRSGQQDILRGYYAGACP